MLWLALYLPRLSLQAVWPEVGAKKGAGEGATRRPGRDTDGRDSGRAEYNSAPPGVGRSGRDTDGRPNPEARGGIGILYAVSDSYKGGRRGVRACTPAAEMAGIRAGMSLDAARALAPNLRIRPRDRDAEQNLLERLATWAGRFTPRVSLVSRQGLLLEVAGSLSLFGGLQDLSRQVRDGLQGLGCQADLGAAPTPTGAWWLALAHSSFEIRRQISALGKGEKDGTASEFVTDRETLARAIAALPLEVMQLPATQLASLQGLGLRTIGDCLGLPRDGLARRFGADLPALLDRALGKAPDPRPNFTPPERFRAVQGLPDAVADSQGLVFVVRRLVLELEGFLVARGMGVERFELHLFHHRPPATRFTVGLAAPSRDARHLLQLLRQRLERVELADPVLEVGLSADALQPLAQQSRGLFPELEAATETDWTRLVERLSVRLGDDAVHGLCLIPDHRPERAWRPCAAGEKTAIGNYNPRPLWLLAEPRPLRSEQGRLWLGSSPRGRLQLQQGPERIETGWWDGFEIARDYFVATHSSGERLWIFRERGGDRRWFLHGLFG